MSTNRALAVTGYLIALAALSCAAASCKEENRDIHPSTNHEPAPAKLTSAPIGKVDLSGAQTMFNERCVVCHGAEGKGNGPAAGALNPKPRNYTDATWQGTVTDEQLRKTIKLGGAAVGKSPLMPASPDLDEKPEVVEGLVQIIRKFGS